MQQQSSDPHTLYIKCEDSEQWLFRGRYMTEEAARLAYDRILKFRATFPGKPQVTENRILPIPNWWE